MARYVILIFLLGFLIGFPVAFAQEEEPPLRIFGYFQASFRQWSAIDFQSSHPDLTGTWERPPQNSFNLQQLNLFLSKDISRHWRAFVNFEILNTFSSGKQWGSFNLEEAWLRYKPGDKFNLKIGLLIPIFNNLNEIKNRTPLLPYVIRPLLYESSFSEIIGGFEEGVPARAYAEASGIIPLRKAKFDYAIYIGNSPNINNQSDKGQTGVDTTNTFLVGGRVGVHFKDLKIGVSATHDKVNRQWPESSSEPLIILKEMPRIRLGGDLSFHLRQLYFEGEFINVMSKDDALDINFNGGFYYGTLGYHVTEQVFVYGGYWYLTGNYPVVVSTMPQLVINTGSEKASFPTIGIAYHLNDRITFKGQFLPAAIQENIPLMTNETLVVKQKFSLFALAASVFF